MRTGLDRTTGRVLQGWDHCAQSIMTIVTTAIGCRPLARAFGSDAPDLQDKPQTPDVLMDHFVAIAEALRKWEPGYRLRKVDIIRMGGDGVTGFNLAGDFYPGGHLGDYSHVVPMVSFPVPLPGFALAGAP